MQRVTGEKFLCVLNAGLMARSGRRTAGHIALRAQAPSALDRAVAAPQGPGRGGEQGRPGPGYQLSARSHRHNADVSEGRPQTSTGVRVGLAVIAIAGAGVAIVAAISQLWLTAVGSSLTAVAMAGSWWTTRPRRSR
jgi:hypothetical protein